MAIEFRCSQCSQLLRVPDNSAGKNARCPKCQALMVVPSAAPLGPQPEMSAPPAPAMTAPPNLETAPSAPLPLPPSPPKPIPDSPFGGGSSVVPGSINPYASAASVGPVYAPQHYWGGPRPGLPWENERQTIGCW